MLTPRTFSRSPSPMLLINPKGKGFQSLDHKDNEPCCEHFLDSPPAPVRHDAVKLSLPLTTLGSPSRLGRSPSARELSPRGVFAASYNDPPQDASSPRKKSYAATFGNAARTVGSLYVKESTPGVGLYEEQEAWRNNSPSRFSATFPQAERAISPRGIRAIPLRATSPRGTTSSRPTSPRGTTSSRPTSPRGTPSSRATLPGNFRRASSPIANPPAYPPPVVAEAHARGYVQNASARSHYVQKPCAAESPVASPVARCHVQNANGRKAVNDPIVRKGGKGGDVVGAKWKFWADTLWQDYDIETCRMLNEADAKGWRMVHVSIDHLQYTIDLHAFVQINDRTGVVHGVMKLAEPHQTSEVLHSPCVQIPRSPGAPLSVLPEEDAFATPVASSRR